MWPPVTLSLPYLECTTLLSGCLRQTQITSLPRSRAIAARFTDELGLGAGCLGLSLGLALQSLFFPATLQIDTSAKRTAQRFSSRSSPQEEENHWALLVSLRRHPAYMESLSLTPRLIHTHFFCIGDLSQ